VVRSGTPCALCQYFINFVLSCLSLRFFNQQQGLRRLVLWCAFSPLSFSSNLIAALLVLDRLMVFSKLKIPSVPSPWSRCSCVAVAAVVAGAGASLICNVVSSVHFLSAAALFDEVGPNVTTAQHNATRLAASNTANQGVVTAAFQFLFEAFMLPIIIVLFVVVGVASARRVNHVILAAGHSSISMRSLSAHGAAETPLHLMRKIVGTCIVVFAGLLVRAVLAIMVALATGLSNSQAECDTYTNRCSYCYNLYTHMFVWLLYTPTIYFVVLLMGQPVVMLVALWGMSSGQMLALMKANSGRPAGR
jgi:hypothetical protein